MNNIVIDIETLGRRNDAAVTQIGIAVSDKEFNLIEKRLIQITPEAWHTCNRTFTGDTIMWWQKQENTPVSNEYTDYDNSYKTVLFTLSSILHKYQSDDTVIWTKGAMDLFCLKDLYEYFDMELPWKFWQPKDIRTAKEFIKDWKTIKVNNHNALEDALNELEELKINFKNK